MNYKDKALEHLKETLPYELAERMAQLLSDINESGCGTAVMVTLGRKECGAVCFSGITNVDSAMESLGMALGSVTREDDFVRELLMRVGGFAIATTLPPEDGINLIYPGLQLFPVTMDDKTAKDIINNLVGKRCDETTH